MSVTLPSKIIYSIDVPEITSLSAQFRYNFFVSDEAFNESGAVPSRFLERPSETRDAKFVQQSTTYVPRLVILTWKQPQIKTRGNKSKEGTLRQNKNSKKTLIAENLNKIVSEDWFSSDDYVSLNFHDANIQNRAHDLVSGSYVMRSITEYSEPLGTSISKISSKMYSYLDGKVSYEFLATSLDQLSKSDTARFYDQNGKQVSDSFFEALRGVHFNTQINGKILEDVISNAIRDPFSIRDTDVKDVYISSKSVKSKSTKNKSADFNDSQYKTKVPFVDVLVKDQSAVVEEDVVEHVGYIIDRYQISPDGSVRDLSPIIIENPNITRTADLLVKYGTTYAYTIRTIMLYTVSAIDEDTGNVALLKLLVSSKPSNQAYVDTIDKEAPPPPVDIEFTWNYDRINPTTAQYDSMTGQAYANTGYRGSLMLTWNFPINSQRDIKKFQVFRRKTINEPFELIKVYDFDDSQKKWPDTEKPPLSLVEYSQTPVLFHYDDDFFVGEHNQYGSLAQKGGGFDNQVHPGSTTYIYAIAAVDAHGLTSNYSAQFEVWFDQFRNVIKKRLVSHSGAPKSYPNLYLEESLFLDTLAISGYGSKTAKVIFNPEYYSLVNNEGKKTNVYETAQRGGSYVFQFINVDSQKSATVNVTIDDQLNETGLSSDSVQLTNQSVSRVKSSIFK